jgi:hypothetical protein
MGNVYTIITKGGSSGLNYSTIFSPSLLVFLVTSFLFTIFILSIVYPYSGNIFYRAYLDIMPQQNIGGQEVHEGFVLELPYDPSIQETVISKSSLLQKLQSYINRIELPPGITCNPDPKKKGVSRLAVEGYLKRLMMSTTKKLSQKEFEEWSSLTYIVFTHTCKERSLLAQLLNQIHQDSRTGYSTNELRSLMDPLLKFYEKARVKDNRFRSREDVNQILNIPIGEREPRNETALKGINAFNLKTSVHDTGGNPNAPSDYSDPFSYFSVDSDTDNKLPTQTNVLRTLDMISDKPIKRANTQTRGSNA